MDFLRCGGVLCVVGSPCRLWWLCIGVGFVACRVLLLMLLFNEHTRAH